MNGHIGRAHPNLGTGTRGVALRFIIVVCVGVAVGSVLPEAGDLVALHLDIWPHAFNPYFLLVGLIGVGLTLVLGYRSSRIRS